MGSSYQSLIAKLDEFIRKYYLNQLIRGAIYALGGFAIFFLLVALLEHFGRFDTGARTFLFYSLILFSGFILIRYVAVPLLKIYKLGTTINYEQAAKIIGTHFSNVQDKLINVLQLSGGRGTVSGSQALLEASIDQKIFELRPVPFSAAVDLSLNRRYALWAGIPLLVLLLMIGLAPQIILESTKRLVAHNTYFAPPAPFQFTILNKALSVPAREDLLLQVMVDGSALPEEIFVESAGTFNRLQKDDANNFHYNFRNITEPITFRLSAAGIASEKFTISVIPKPVLMGFGINLEFPAYTGIKPMQLSNQGDLKIPEGTTVTWNFSTAYAGDVSLKFNDSTIHAQADGDNKFRHSSTFRRSSIYTIGLSNDQMQQPDQASYVIDVVADQHPVIEIEERRDTVAALQGYFRGNIMDDYGFSRLFFHVVKTENGAQIQAPVKSALKVTNSENAQVFYHSFDFSTLELEPGQQAEYFFEVWDNDGVNGSKSSRSQRMILKMPTLKELAEMNEAGNQQVKSTMESALKEVRNLQKEFEDLQKKLLEKQQPTWEEKKKLQDLLDRQKKVEEKIAEMQQQMSEQFRNMEEFGNPNPELMEKQKMLEELMDQVMTEEMRKMMEELQKLMEQMTKEKMQDAIEEMKLNSKDVEKELDRSLEMFKKLEVEQKADEIIQQLEKLAEEEEKLAEKTADKKSEKEELQKEQESLKKDFEELRKQIDEMEKKNQELEQPMPMESTDKKEDEVSRKMDESKKELEKNNRKQAGEQQKQAAQDMKEMASQMEQAMAAGQQQQQGEDIQAIRQLLENLVRLSLDQEEVMEAVKTSDRNGPQYNKLMQEQRKIKDDAKMIEDSLFALSKRVPQIDAIVNREISSINSNLQKTLEHMEDRQPPMAGQRQQYVMTSTNNLALLLSDAVKKMQQQMQQMKGGASCPKPGGSSSSQPSASEMRQMQQQINQQMQRMKEQMEKEGGSQKGARGKGGSMSEELARMAAKQQAIRQFMQQMTENLGEEGEGGKGSNGSIMKKMEETETDLVNKRITQETLKRQQEILTRLLEAEKAERQREMDPKRQSRQAQDISAPPSPERFFDYQKIKENEAEMLRLVPPQLLPFYRNKVNEYFNNLEK